MKIVFKDNIVVHYNQYKYMQYIFQDQYKVKKSFWFNCVSLIDSWLREFKLHYNNVL